MNLLAFLLVFLRVWWSAWCCGPAGSPGIISWLVYWYSSRKWRNKGDWLSNGCVPKHYYCTMRRLQVFDAGARHLKGWVVEGLDFLHPGVVEDMGLGICLDVADDFNGSLVGNVLVPLSFL